jgi:uncharacterized repeat protein (TIGR01451 family)
MNTATIPLRHAGVLVLFGASALFSHPALAQDGNRSCVQLRNDVLMEQKFVGADGRAAVREVSPAKVIPGTVMVYTITAHNACTSVSDHLAITNPVPDHMQLVGGSATHDVAEPLYALDATHFDRLEVLAAREPDGISRPARSEDIRSIRWTLAQGLAAGQSVSVQFRATVQ